MKSVQGNDAQFWAELPEKLEQHRRKQEQRTFESISEILKELTGENEEPKND